MKQRCFSVEQTPFGRRTICPLGVEESLCIAIATWVGSVRVGNVWLFPELLDHVDEALRIASSPAERELKPVALVYIARGSETVLFARHDQVVITRRFVSDRHHIWSDILEGRELAALSRAATWLHAVSRRERAA